MKTPSLSPQQDRAAAALLGAFIGDAMGLGPHWYYDLDEQRRDYGDWIAGYTDPKPDRYHGGLKAGDLSQAGLILKMTIPSSVLIGMLLLFTSSPRTEDCRSGESTHGRESSERRARS